MKKANKPTEQELNMLQQAKQYYGRSWRSKIYTAWHSGNYEGFRHASELQRMRNNPDREWHIDRVKV